jgi:membrane-bound lytic murein transglycosylase D
MKRLVLFVLSGFLFSQTWAFNNLSAKDSSVIDDDKVYLNFDSNLDSLLNLWYVNNGVMHGAYVPEIDDSNDALALNIADSVYIDRLARIPTTVQLSYNPIVRKHIEYYLTRHHSQVENMLGLANYYFPIFDNIFDYYGVPNEIKYMSIIESALNPRAYSRTRAVGLWQFMPATGHTYGLEVNSLVDERRDLIKSTQAACRLSKDLYRIYGDWMLVIAAYNCGPGNVNKAIKRSGGKRNYWDIYYYLPKETRGHVPAFIAATYLMNYYKDHNLVPRKTLLPMATDTIMISADLNLNQVAEVMHLPIDMLRDLNPQYAHDIIPGHTQKYPLYLPVEYTSRFIDLSDSIFAYKDSIYFDKNYLTFSPKNVSPEKSGKYAVRTSSSGSKVFHKVKSGENLGSIAQKYGVSVTELKQWNNLHKSKVLVGQKLVVYSEKEKKKKTEDLAEKEVAKESKEQVKETSSKNETAAKSKAKTATKTTAKPITKSAKETFDYYTVKQGDTIWGIAQQVGVTGNDLCEWNDIEDNIIKPGQVLKIKKN